MTINARSRLPTVAASVGDALRRHGIKAVLTGGACACLHSGGRYQSVDVDFVLTAPTTQVELDRAMQSVGFARRGDHYRHPRVRFYVEFPPGPLAIGGDLLIRPVLHGANRGRLMVLSPTDSCRDRLAAFYHWNDRQSLAVAVAIGLTHRLQIARIRRWSIAEGALDRFGEFMAELRRARRVKSA